MITNLEKLIECCRDELADREYANQRARNIETEWNKILQWYKKQGFAHFNTEIGYKYCDEIIGSHLIVKGMSKNQKLKLRAIRMLTSYQLSGDFEYRSPCVERKFIGETGSQILQFLSHERLLGRSPKTIECRKLYLYCFNQYLLQKGLSFDNINLDVIEDFFKSINYKLSERHNCANHLRQLFHYLYDQGYSKTDNAIFVLKDQYRKQNKLPSTYTEDEIKKTIEAIERSSAIGKRDYLIILLAAEYGWRTSDIVNFKFEQIDWDKNIISFNQNKTDTPVEFPLLSSVGNAIIDYLQHGRPESNTPEIIVSAESGQRGQPLKPATIHSIVTKYLRKAQIPHWKNKRHGAHALRHSLATHLLQKNVSMPVISTVLGHQKTDSTKIYLKIDIEKLALCPIPMPSLRSPYFKEVIL